MTQQGIVLLLGLAAVTAEAVPNGCKEEDESCTAEAGAGSLGGRSYHWPHARGKAGLLGLTNVTGPTNLEKAFWWKWHHPDGRFHTMLKGAPLFDDERNIYLLAIDQLYKFSPDGKLLWTYWPSIQVPKWNAVANCPSLHNGAVFGSTVNGYVWAANMGTGKELWIRKVYNSVPGRHEAVGGDTGSIDGYGGVVVSAGEIWNKNVVAGNRRVTSLNATDGQLLWEFEVHPGMWNFAAHFLPAGSHGVEEATVLFQDVEGRLYRLGLYSGTLIWKSGGSSGCWTDGSMNVGPNGVAYTVTVEGKLSSPGYTGGPDMPGYVFAIRLRDGEVLWTRTLPRPPNSMPVIGPLGEGGRLLLVLPIGQQAGDPPRWQDIMNNWDYEENMTWHWGAWFMHKISLLLGDWQQRIWDNPTLPNDVYALDPETGDTVWRWEGVTYRRISAAGDEEGLLVRIQEGKMFGCLPCPWGYPAIDASGTIYVGNQNGKLYALRDTSGNGSGVVEAVSTFDTEACFLCASGGVTFAPGIMAVATCDSLFVFRV